MKARLLLNRRILKSNLEWVRSKTTSQFICPMVKANAYGVGEGLVVGELLEMGIKTLGVARLEEALRIRRMHPNAKLDILVFHPLYGEVLHSYIEAGLTAVVASEADLRFCEDLSLEQKKLLKPVHLKFDLGMNRLGFELSQAKNVAQRFLDSGLSVGGVAGHLPVAEDVVGNLEVSSKISQLKDLALQLGLTDDKIHIPNTAAIESASFNFGLRPGLGLYGFSSKENSGLKPALTLEAPIVAIRAIKKGDSASYGGTWKAERDTYLGVLPIGYADGLRRGLSNRIKVRFQGQELPQVGTICMDYCMVDLGSDSKFKLGEYVTFFDELMSEQYSFAKKLGTISYEILTGLGARIERRAVSK